MEGQDDSGIYSASRPLVLLASKLASLISNLGQRRTYQGTESPNPRRSATRADESARLLTFK